MKIKAAIIIITSSLFCLFGCQSTNVDPPDCGVDPAHMNNEIKSDLMNEWNSYKKWDGTSIFVQAIKQMPITFPANLNLNVYIFDIENQIWISSKNQTVILGGDYFEILNKEDNYTIRTITLDLPNSQETVKVFYCISGVTVDGISVGASGSYKLFP